MIGNNFKLRSVLILFVVSSIFLLANFVSAATYDATGGWFVSVSNGWTDGGVGCPLEEDSIGSLTITQNGDSATLVLHESDRDRTYNGTVNDNNYNFTAFYVDGGGKENTIQVTFTLSSSTSGTGQVEISNFDPGANTTCERGMDITLTKQGAAPTYDGTGEWKYSTSNIYTGGGPCGPLDPVIGTSTVTQIGNNVTLVAHDPEGDITFTGTVSGGIYSLTASFPEGAGTITMNMIFDLTLNNSGPGKGTYTWTDGIITCNGRFDIAFTKQMVIGLDAVHFDGSPNTYNLYAGANYSSFRWLITGEPFGLEHEIVPLTTFSSEELAGVDVAVLLISTLGRLLPDESRVYGDGIPYTDDQIAAIQALARKGAVFLSDSTMFTTAIWYEDNEILAKNIINYLVESGGGVLFLSDNNGDLDHACDIDNWNNLVAPFGIRYSYPLPDFNYPENIIEDFFEHPITEGVESLRVLSYPKTTIAAPSFDLTPNCGADDALAVYEHFTPSASLTVFVNDKCTQIESVAGFGFAPDSHVTLEIDNGADGCVDYRATKTPNPEDGVVWFFPHEGFSVNIDDLVRLYDDQTPRTVKDHRVDYLTLTGVDLYLDAVWGTANPNEEVFVRVFDPEQPFPGGSDFTNTANINGGWQVSSEEDIGSGSSGWVQTNDSDGDHTRINWQMPVRNIQVIWNSDSTQIRGLVGYGWEPESEVELEFHYGDFQDGNPSGGGVEPVCLTSVNVESDGVVRFLPYDHDQGAAGTDYYWSCPNTTLNFGIHNVMAGNMVVASDYGNNSGIKYNKLHIIELLRIDQVDWKNDTLRGQAYPGKEVEVRVIDPSLPFPEGHDLTAVADAGGNWSANYAGIFDIKVGNEGWVQISDDDDDSTRVNWHIISLPSDLEVDGTLEFEPGGNKYVKDDQYVETAGVRVSGEWLTESIDVKIHVFEEKPFGFPVITSEMTHYMSIELDPSSYPLPPMGLNVRLPLDRYTHPEFSGEMFTLYRVDPETGDLVPAPSWHFEGGSPVLRPWTNCMLFDGPQTSCGAGQVCPGEYRFVECFNVASFSTLVAVYQEEIQVMIDIKPGSDPNSINLKSKGVIPLSIQTTDIFDATNVDPMSVEFGPDGAKEAHGKGHIEDVDEDGDLDLVLHFRTQNTGIACGDTSASLTGQTFDGQLIEGSDSIKTLKCK